MMTPSGPMMMNQAPNYGQMPFGQVPQSPMPMTNGFAPNVMMPNNPYSQYGGCMGYPHTHCQPPPQLQPQNQKSNVREKIYIY